MFCLQKEMIPEVTHLKVTQVIWLPMPETGLPWQVQWGRPILSWVAGKSRQRCCIRLFSSQGFVSPRLPTALRDSASGRRGSLLCLGYANEKQRSPDMVL